MRKEAKELQSRIRGIDGTEWCYVGHRYGEKKEFCSSFEKRFSVKFPSEVVHVLMLESAISDFHVKFIARLESTIICGWSQNSWVDLRGQMSKTKDTYRQAGESSLVPFWEKGAIILEDFWAGFALVVDITGPETYDLRFVVPSGKSYKIKLTLPQYVDCLVQARGLFPWQLMFIDEKVEGLELGYEFYAVLAALAEGEPILNLPQFKMPDPAGSLAEMAVRFGYYDGIQQYLKPLGGAGYDYGEFKENRGRGYNFIARVENDLGKRLPDELRTWFYLYDEVSLQWRKNKKAAALKLLPIRTVFGGDPSRFEYGLPTPPFNRDAVHYYNDPSATELLSGLYPFMVDERGDVVISIAEGKVELYLLDSDVTSKKKLQVTLPEFIAYLCKARGIAGWHTYLVNPTEEELAELRAMVEEVFPGTEW
jgi:hypothetical protein